MNRAAMDPELANLNLDPPTQPSPLRRGLLPALLVHVAFFFALALSLQWNRDSPSDTLATSGTTQSDTRTMGAAPSAAAEPATPPDVQPVTAPPGMNAPSASPTPAPAAVEPMQATPPAPVRPPVEQRRSENKPRPASQPVARATTGVTPVSRTEIRPSFDCARARSRTERLICGDAELAALDRDTGRLHARARAAARNPAAFKRQNDAEWKQREAKCRDKTCLLAWYAHRRAQLQQVVAQAR
ncbi:hypothetical protein ACPWT1_06765 [Ramlibacter sp. MMS24-I3-19]|uniref:lysozyme inhibitor LprI family protein n=1 Tax=Ramlibacter sp. MMS24-I3-19 TaxID=3416606 RepID=UPI003D01AF4A